MSHLQASVLVLNRSFVPIHVTSLRRAFTLLYLGVAQAIDEQFRLFDFQSWSELSAERSESIGTSSARIRIPWVIVLVAFDRFPRTKVRFSRHNIFLRDENTCQYCARTLPRAELNLDHVVPRAQGGGTTWENVVCSCITCNLKKGGRTPQQANMKLLRAPFRPKWSPVYRNFGKHIGHESWKPFLSLVDASYWNTELLSD